MNVLLLSLSLLLSACSMEAAIYTIFSQDTTISGKLAGFSQISSLSVASNNSLSTMSCSSPKVSIYKIDPNGARVEPALDSVSISVDGSYSFVLKKLGLSASAISSDALIVVASGCTSGVYSRPVTGANNQDITMGSTVVSYLAGTQFKDKLSAALLTKVSQVDALLKSIASEQSFASAYDVLVNNGLLNSQFQQLFEVSPSVLLDAAPEITSLTIPETGLEKAALNFNITITQWSSAYIPVFEWKLDNTVISQSSSIAYTPGGNSQGNYTLTLTVGQNNGSGQIDMAKPTTVITRAISISNNILPVAPAFTVTAPLVVGSQPINSRNLTVTLDTGANKINCDSFASLALTEGVDGQPAPSSFNISCSQAGTQGVSLTVTSAGDGTKTLRLWAMDSSGVISVSPSIFSFNLDTGIPSVSISTIPLAMSNMNSQSFVFSGSDNGGSIDHYDCQIDAGSWATCSSPQSYSSLAEGDHTFSVRAVDTAGNISVADSKTWHIDLTAPVLTLAGTPNSVTNSLAATFSFSATDSGGSGLANYYCLLDSAVSFTQCTAVQSYTLAAGTHTLQVKASDNAGNSSSAQNYSWTIDTTPPTSSITSNPTSLNNSQSASFSFTGSDSGGGAVASYECQLDGSAFAACVTPKSYSSLVSGSHTFAVRAIDTAGNIGTSSSYSWTIDLTTPLASINSGPNSITNSTSASFTFSANPPPSGSIVGYECRLDGAVWSSCSSPKTYSGLVQGSHTFDVRSIDNNSNYSTPTSYAWTIDTTAPVVTVGSAPTSLNNSSSASFSFSATDSGGGSVVGYQCKLDSGSYADCSSPTNLTNLPQGSHAYYVTALDSAGNTSAPVSTTWTVDLTAPALTLSSTPDIVTNATTASFSFSATDSGGGAVSSYSCSIDGAAYASCSSPKSYSSLGAGAHTFAVVVTDTAGNTSGATTFSWTVDLTAPTLSITAKPNSITNATTASFSFSGNDTGGGTIASYSCKLDAGSYATCTSPQAYASLAAGAHTFSVTVTDTAGNTSSEQSYSWTIDTTPPTVTITTPSSNGTIALTSSLASYSVGGACSENGVAVVLSGASSLSVPCSSGAWSTNIDISSLSDGTLSLTATQTDAAGNSASSAARTFVKDTVAPSISITTPIAFQGNTSTGTVTWSLTEPNVASSTNFTVELYNGTSWSTLGTKAATAGANSNQSYTLSGFALPSVDTNTAKIRVSLTDAAGNSSTQISANFYIQTTPPTIYNLGVNGGAGSTSSSFVSMSLGASDTLTNITDFCFVLDVSTVPLDTDSCWTAVNSPQPGVAPALNISFANYNWLMSYVSGSHNIYAWVRNLAKLKNSAQFVTILKTAPTPPTVGAIQVTNSTTPGNPLTKVDTSFNGSQPAYIQWTASGTTALTINLSYKTNSGTTAIVSGLANGSNGGCTVDTAGGYTGCYVWSNPPSTYFAVVVLAIDTNSNSSSNTSYPLNAPNINVIAGNTDLGIGTTATRAIISEASAFGDPGSLVVTTDGRLFYRDRVSGLLVVDPKTGNVNQVMPITGTASGDGGPVTGATLCAAQKIALDYSDNILIFDCTKIRKINTNVSPMTISTIIGGGTQTVDGTSALNFEITAPSTQSSWRWSPKNLPFYTLPNGNIYFVSQYIDQSISSGYKIRYYNAADGNIYSITPSGAGTAEDSTLDITAPTVWGFGIGYEPITSVITTMFLLTRKDYIGDSGMVISNLNTSTYVSTAPHPGKPDNGYHFVQAMDGSIYVVDYYAMQVKKFNSVNQAWVTVAGGGGDIACADGELATNCHLGAFVRSLDAFVTAKGTVYFLDNYGIVRIVLSDGTVRTVLGQSKSYGSGGSAVLARIADLNQVEQDNSGAIYYRDTLFNNIMQFSIGSIVSNRISVNAPFVVQPTTSDIYYLLQQGSLMKLPAASSTASFVINPNMTYAGEMTYAATSNPFGFDGVSKMFYNTAPWWNGTQGYHNSNYAVIDLADSSNTMFTGFTGASPYLLCSDLVGTLASSCGAISDGTFQYDSTTTPARWLILQNSQARIWTVNEGGMSTNESFNSLVALPRAAVSFIFRISGGSQLIDYCGSDGLLYSYNLTTGTDTAYPWPVTSLRCIGNTLKYNSSRNSLIFPAKQNGLGTVIEYRLSP